jgi:hypothetical protein
MEEPAVDVDHGTLNRILAYRDPAGQISEQYN